MGKPVFVLRKNTTHQIEQFIGAIPKNKRAGTNSMTDKSLAILEAEKAIHKIISGHPKIELKSQNSHLRRIQHGLAQDSGLDSISSGIEPDRKVVISSAS